MKLEVGMYVRTDEGIITKIIDNRDNVIIKTSDYTTHLRSKVIKASFDIIDLIEVGDVITTNNLCGQVTYIEGDKIYTTCYDGECCYDYQIQSIVTKEQFETMQYKVVE